VAIWSEQRAEIAPPFPSEQRRDYRFQQQSLLLHWHGAHECAMTSRAPVPQKIERNGRHIGVELRLALLWQKN